MWSANKLLKSHIIAIDMFLRRQWSNDYEVIQGFSRFIGLFPFFWCIPTIFSRFPEYFGSIVLISNRTIPINYGNEPKIQRKRWINRETSPKNYGNWPINRYGKLCNNGSTLFAKFCNYVLSDEIARVWAEIHADKIKPLKYFKIIWKIWKRFNNMHIFHWYRILVHLLYIYLCPYNLYQFFYDDQTKMKK